MNRTIAVVCFATLCFGAAGCEDHTHPNAGRAPIPYLPAGAQTSNPQQNYNDAVQKQQDSIQRCQPYVNDKGQPTTAPDCK